MVKTIFSGAWRIGRATALALGVAVMLAMVAGVTSAAFGANADPWRLGQNNVATAITTLGGTFGANGPMVRLINNNGGTNDTALELRVQPGEAPMRVNSNTRVDNLNADQLDGQGSTSFLSSSVYTKQSTSQGVANEIKEADLDCDAGDVMLSGGYFFGSGTEVLSDTVFNNRYFLAWRSGDQPVNAVLRVTCADQ